MFLKPDKMAGSKLGTNHGQDARIYMFWVMTMHTEPPALGPLVVVLPMRFLHTDHNDMTLAWLIQPCKQFIEVPQSKASTIPGEETKIRHTMTDLAMTVICLFSDRRMARYLRVTLEPFSFVPGTSLCPGSIEGPAILSV